jgi:hypothetical protein
MELELECIAIEKDDGASAILGHAGFIKTVEDLYEAMVGASASSGSPAAAKPRVPVPKSRVTHWPVRGPALRARSALWSRLLDRVLVSSA